MRKTGLWLATTLVAAIIVSGAAQATCPAGATVAKVTKKTSAVRSGGKIYFRTSGLQLDFDGSPRAYGVRDQGEENICVGLAPSDPPCRGKYRGTCYPVCQSTFAKWSRTSGDPARIGDTMCSVGLGGSECSKPDVRLQDAPNQDWFVSETSLKTGSPSGSNTAAWLRGQAAQLDPAKIRYLVAPGSLMKPPWNARLGDVGIAFNGDTKQPIPFIVGDGGGLGEGSVSLLAALRPDKPPKLKKVRSALGEDVMRYTSGVDGNFQFVIFTGTASNAAGSNHVTSRPASELNDWIDATAKNVFQNASSVAEVASCSALAPAIKK